MRVVSIALAFGMAVVLLGTACSGPSTGDVSGLKVDASDTIVEGEPSGGRAEAIDRVTGLKLA